MYHILIISVMVLINTSVALFAAFVCYSILKFPSFRQHLLESAQDGDEVTHFSDGKNVICLVLGLFASWFTFDLACIFAYERLFDYGSMAFLILFVGITFTLLGIAWKK